MCKRLCSVLMLTAAVVVLAGCGPSSKLTVQERQAKINDMAQQSLASFYEKRPELRQEVNSAPGYGVFSNANVSIIFASGGGGYGVVVNNVTGKRTYMKSGTGGLGLGIGAKDYRQLMVFNSPDALHAFVNGDWTWGGEATAAAKAERKGAAATTAKNVSNAVEVYTLTESGLSAELMATGAKYWPVDDLNAPSAQRQQYQQNGESRQNGEYRQNGEVQTDGEAQMDGELHQQQQDFQQQQQEFQQQQQQNLQQQEQNLQQQQQDLQQQQQDFRQQQQDYQQTQQELQQKEQQLEQRHQQLRQQEQQIQEQMQQIQERQQQLQQNQQTQQDQTLGQSNR